MKQFCYCITFLGILAITTTLAFNKDILFDTFAATDLSTSISMKKNEDPVEKVAKEIMSEGTETVDGGALVVGLLKSVNADAFVGNDVGFLAIDFIDVICSGNTCESCQGFFAHIAQFVNIHVVSVLVKAELLGKLVQNRQYYCAESPLISVIQRVDVFAVKFVDVGSCRNEFILTVGIFYQHLSG